MKILLIDNNTKHLPELTKALAGHDIEQVAYMPGRRFGTADKDLIVLSGGGGEGNEINDRQAQGGLWYEDELRLVQKINKPIVGICMGFEVIARAFGAEVKPAGRLIKGWCWVNATTAGQQAFGQNRLKQYEAHRWCAPSAPAGFKVLAGSASGVEIMAHQSRPIIAVQFHPEVAGGSLNLGQIIDLVLSAAPAGKPMSVHAAS